MKSTLVLHDQHIFRKLSLWEIFALALCIGLSILFSLDSKYAVDFLTYLQAGQGDLSIHYYAFWILPVFQLLTKLPIEVSLVMWNIVNVAGIFMATRIFGGRVPIVLLTFQMLYVLNYGQIVGILIGALSLFYLALHYKHWYFAGFCLLIACTKPQFGCTFGLVILLLMKLEWREWIKVLLLPAIISILSLIWYPLWPLDSLNIIANQPPNTWGSISLWRWIGPLALVLWLPPLLLTLSSRTRLIVLAATIALTMPYFQQTDLLMLFALPVGWLPLLGNLGFVLIWRYGHAGLKWLVIVPLIAYSFIIVPASMQWLAAKRQNAV